MAIAATWIVNDATVTSSASQFYTVPSTQVNNSGATVASYYRDLVINNSGTVSIYVGLSTLGTVATTTASLAIPAGGSVVLTQCQVPSGAVVSALTASGSSGISVGYGTNVMYV